MSLERAEKAGISRLPRQRPAYDSGDAIFHLPEYEPIFGDLWVWGQSLLVWGNTGTGKTTLATKLALAWAEIVPLEKSMFGWPFRRLPGLSRNVLYVATDRRFQIMESAARFVNEKDHGELMRERWTWTPDHVRLEDLPYMADDVDAGLVVVDAIQPLLGDSPEKPAAGQAYDKTRQRLLNARHQVYENHHENAQGGMYGSVQFIRGTGSSLHLMKGKTEGWIEYKITKHPRGDEGRTGKVLFDGMTGEFIGGDSDLKQNELMTYSIVKAAGDIGLPASEIAETAGVSTKTVLRHLTKLKDRKVPMVGVTDDNPRNPTRRWIAT